MCTKPITLLLDGKYYATTAQYATLKAAKQSVARREYLTDEEAKNLVKAYFTN